MHIVCNIDNNYTKYCAVMLTSLFENNKGTYFVIHIICDQLSKENQSVLKEIVETKYNNQMRVYCLGEHFLDNFYTKSDSHISKSTYYRLFISSIIDDSVTKVLYLDCDLVVVGSICDLWNTDISNYAIGVVEDMWSGKEDNYIRLSYDSLYSYFNAGVMLINLNYWRQNFIESELLKYANCNMSRLIFYDQDVLNAVLYQHKKNLPLRWNMQDGFLRKKKKIKREYLDVLDTEIGLAVIIHFTGSKKPWHYKSVHPYKSEYFKYLDLTQWKGERPSVQIIPYIMRRINNVLKCFGLYQERYVDLDEKRI